jgi:hypothetical protein
LPIYSAYVRWSLRRWRAASPDDPRTPERVELIKRRFEFPTPDDRPGDIKPGATSLLGTFDVQGNLLP